MAVIYGFRVDGTTYQYDYNHLANKPSEIPTHGYNDSGKVLTVSGSGTLEWKSPSSGGASSSGEESSGGGLPSTSYANSGDVLMFTYESDGGSLEWGQVLPAYDCGDNDKALVVKDGCIEWDYALPAWSNDDVGKVLTINEDGEPEWLPAGGL